MEGKPIRWLHLSDFHVGKDDYATRKMFDYILGHMRQRKQDGFSPDLLFITGDLANRGLAEEYLTLWEELIWPLQETIGNDIDQRTFTVPGNHDVDRKQFPAFSREHISAPESQYLDPTPEGARLRGEMLVPRFQAYLDNDATSTSAAFARSEGGYAQRLTLHGHEIGIAGINTAWLSKDDGDERRLTPGKGLLETVLGAIESTQLRIVLGHHPVDWFIPAQQKTIKSLLGRHHALYLHGHMHDHWAEPTYGGGQTYLTIQSGAGFQAREGDLRRWRNGLIWGEVDLQAGDIRLQPRHWIADHQAWTLAAEAFHEDYRHGDWWRYALPGKVDYRQAKPAIPTPKGWKVHYPAALDDHLGPLDTQAALRYFDGAVPDWSTALSVSIPRRGIVTRLVERFSQAESAGRPIVTLLLAAGCEGKSTALLQAAHAVAGRNENWRILQRQDESKPLTPEDIRVLLDEKHHWLIVVDEADNAASALHALLKRLPDTLHGKVHALLACRDTDWLSSQATPDDWSVVADFHQERLSGLDERDAEAIVQAWQNYGAEGLGDLLRTPESERAEALKKRAREEAATQSGAFFGALLEVRNGSDLRSHASLLLDRLGQRAIPGNATLRDALAYIAAMHAERFEFLSRPVLAEALGCPLSRLHREVLMPLGQEAAATTTSSSIMTRHRRIAETLISVLQEDFQQDIGMLYINLTSAAMTAARTVRTPFNLKHWRYDITNHFLATQRGDLAFNLARTVLDLEPADAKSRTHLANLYRRAGMHEQATQIFREITTQIENDRYYYYEWGVAEGNCGRQTNSALLEVFSLTDQCPARRVDNDQAKSNLAGLGVAFKELFAAYHDPAFRAARMAVATMGLTLLLDPKTRRYLEIHLRESSSPDDRPPDIEQAILMLQAGIEAAEQIGVDSQIGAVLPKSTEMTFDGLKLLISHAAFSGKKAR